MSLTTSPQVRLSRRRWLNRCLYGLLALEVLYVLAFEWAARSGNLARWIDRRPEKIAIAFASAHSYFPFRVSASGLELHGQTPKLRWRLRADRASGWISPLGLLRRTVRFPRIEAHGGEFWLRREAVGPAGPGDDAVSAAREARMPPLAALAPLATPRPAPTRPKWSFELPRVAATGFREVWLGQLRLAGEFGAAGSFSMFAGRELEVGPTRLSYSGVRASIGEAEVGSGLGGGADLRIARYPFKEERGLAALRFLSGSADVEGALAEQALLGLFLSRAPWLSFGSTMGQLQAHLEAERGELRPGTRVEFQHPRLEMRAFDFRAEGDARIHFAVRAKETPGAVAAVLEVSFDDFAVRAGEERRPQFVGSGLSLVATTSERELERVLDSSRVRIDLGTARIPDLAAFGAWIPSSSGLSLVGGSGTLIGSFDADLAANDARGEFVAAIDSAAVRFRDLDLRGGIRVDLHIPKGDLARRSFDLTGTQLRLHDFRSPQAEAAGPAAASASGGWWAHFTLADGKLQLPPEAAASGRFEVNLRDSVPLLGLFETRKELPRWVERLLTVEDIRAGGRLSWSPAETALGDLSTQISNATLRARMRFGTGSRKGVLMVEWHRLALGLRIDNAAKQWKFAGVREWFAKSDLGSSRSAARGDSPISEAALAHAELVGSGHDPRVELPKVGFQYEVVPGSSVRGELDGDPGPEVAAVIALPNVAASNSLRLAAADLVDGRAIPIGSYELAPGLRVLSLTIVEREVIAKLAASATSGSAEKAEATQPLHWRPLAAAPKAHRP
jgi:hypothetical protein